MAHIIFCLTTRRVDVGLRIRAVAPAAPHTRTDTGINHQQQCLLPAVDSPQMLSLHPQSVSLSFRLRLTHFIVIYSKPIIDPTCTNRKSCGQEVV